MEALTNAITSRQNVALTILHGLERSRLLLRCSFALLTKQPRYKFYYVLDRENLVARVQHEASLMPFRELGPEGAQTKLVICSIMSAYKYSKAGNKKRGDSVVVIFDLTSLEALESTMIDLKGLRRNPSNMYDLLASMTKGLEATSIVLACNGPLDGLEPELGHPFPISLTNSPHQVGTIASIITCGPSGSRMIFGGPSLHKKKPKRKDYKARRAEVGAILEALAGHAGSGGILVLFPTYEMTTDFHSAWLKKDVFKRIRLPYGREGRGVRGDSKDTTRRSIQELATKDRSIFLSSAQYQMNEDLAEMVLGRVRLVIIVGLPYPPVNDAWKARIKTHDKDFVKAQKKGNLSSKSGLLMGNQLYKYRAIDYMNGLIKKCLLNSYRSDSCDFFILDEELGNDREKLAKELGDVQVEAFKDALTRYKSLRIAQPPMEAKKTKGCAIM